MEDNALTSSQFGVGGTKDRTWNFEPRMICNLHRVFRAAGRDEESSAALARELTRETVSHAANKR